MAFRLHLPGWVSELANLEALIQPVVAEPSKPAAIFLHLRPNPNFCMAVVGAASPRSKPATFLEALLPASLLEDIEASLL